MSGSDLRQGQVLIDGFRRGAFEDMLDAVSSARIAKQERPTAFVAVADRLTGQLLAEIASPAG
jgi:hypothetical protein